MSNLLLKRQQKLPTFQYLADVQTVEMNSTLEHLADVETVEMDCTFKHLADVKTVEMDCTFEHLADVKPVEMDCTFEHLADVKTVEMDCTFEHFADVKPVEVDSVVVVERAVLVGDAVLCDVDGDVVVVVLEPVHHLPDSKGSHPKPTRSRPERNESS